jgi:hypothetical protein
MKKSAALACLLAACAVARAGDPPAPTNEARIRIAGLFLKGFGVWRVDAPNCATPAGKPWLALDCGMWKCPKPQLLGIPMELDYSNWRKSPRMTEVAIPADQPFVIHLGGELVEASFGAGVLAAAGLPYTVYGTSCRFDAKFTPRAGAMYEATIDPGMKGGCFLRLTEIRATETGNHERVPIEGSEMKACGGDTAAKVP